MSKFDRYCAQLEKYGETESVHSPTMAMLRRKARKQLIELMENETDCSHKVNKLWIVGYYQPYQFFVRESETVMETSTLLTLFCGELHELLTNTKNSKYAAQLNLFIGDLHRYMPDDEIQKILASAFYAKSIELDSRNGRAFFVISTVRDDLGLAERIRLLILAQLAEKPYDTSSKLSDFLADQNLTELSLPDDFLLKFVQWALFEKSSKQEHQKNGAQIVEIFELALKTSENGPDWPMIFSGCRLASRLAIDEFDFSRFMDCFDVITDILMIFEEMSNELLCEAILWSLDVSDVFNRRDDIKNETLFQTVPNFSKIKWNNLNEKIHQHLEPNLKPAEPSFSSNLLLNGPKSEICAENLNGIGQKFILMRSSSSEWRNSPKKLGIPIEKLMEKVDLSNRDDWKPVYVLIDCQSIIDKSWAVRKVWSIDDFIHVLPSYVLAEMDRLKGRNSVIRGLIRQVMEMQSEGRIVMKQCSNELECARILVQSVRKQPNSDDHSQIVTVLTEKPEEMPEIDGVSFYTAETFLNLCLK